MEKENTRIYKLRVLKVVRNKKKKPSNNAMIYFCTFKILMWIVLHLHYTYLLHFKQNILAEAWNHFVHEDSNKLNTAEIDVHFKLSSDHLYTSIFVSWLAKPDNVCVS